MHNAFENSIAYYDGPIETPDNSNLLNAVSEHQVNFYLRFVPNCIFDMMNVAGAKTLTEFYSSGMFGSNAPAELDKVSVVDKAYLRAFDSTLKHGLLLGENSKRFGRADLPDMMVAGGYDTPLYVRLADSEEYRHRVSAYFCRPSNLNFPFGKSEGVEVKMEHEPAKPYLHTAFVMVQPNALTPWKHHPGCDRSRYPFDHEAKLNILRAVIAAACLVTDKRTTAHLDPQGLFTSYLGCLADT